MAKGKKKIELRTINEEECFEDPVIRLIKKKAGGVYKGKEAEEAEVDRRDVKIRPIEPSKEVLTVSEPVDTEGDWEEDTERKRFPVGWLAVLGIWFFIGGLWAVKQMNRSSEYRKEVTVEVGQVLDKEREADLEAERVIASIKAVVRSFVGAGSVEEMAKYVRHPERVLPLMEDFYSREPLVGFDIEGDMTYYPLTLGKSASFWLVGSRLVGGGDKKMLVEVNEMGDVKVDWESFVVYQPMDWDEFVKTRPRGFRGDFRVNVSDDYFFSHEFSDSEKYLSLRLTTVNASEVIFAYVEKESREGVEILKIINGSDSSKKVPMTLGLYVREEEMLSKGVEVFAVRAPRWIYIDPPEIESE